MPAQRRALDAQRWCFEHGPIHCVLQADGPPEAVAEALQAAWQRFETLLAELAAELPLLRRDLQAHGAVPVKGPVAQAMVAACLPHAQEHFITAMAAVAGAVADELVRHFHRPGITRAYVNNGGDIALHLAPGAQWDVGLIADISAGQQGAPHGRFSVRFEDPVRGVATSGWRGRSFSFGVADAVTVLAASAAQADAAATLVANAVDVADARILRRPACELKDDSDLGERRVTVGVPEFSAAQVADALAAGLHRARQMQAQGLIHAAALSLQGQVRTTR